MSWFKDLEKKGMDNAFGLLGGTPDNYRHVDNYFRVARNPTSFATGGLLGGSGGVINWGENKTANGGERGTGKYGAATTNSLRGENEGSRKQQGVGKIVASIYLGGLGGGAAAGAGEAAGGAAAGANNTANQAAATAEAAAKAQAAAQAAADSSQSAGLMGYGDAANNGGASLKSSGLTGKDIMSGLGSTARAATASPEVMGLLTPEEIVPAQMRQGDPAGAQAVAQLYQSSQQATQDEINQAMQGRMQRRQQWG